MCVRWVLGEILLLLVLFPAAILCLLNVIKILGTSRIDAGHVLKRQTRVVGERLISFNGLHSAWSVYTIRGELSQSGVPEISHCLNEIKARCGRCTMGKMKTLVVNQNVEQGKRKVLKVLKCHIYKIGTLDPILITNTYNFTSA